MMVSKVLIDTIKEMNELKNTKMKKIKYFFLINKSYKKIKKIILSINEITPSHLSDYVTFLDLAKYRGFYNKEIYEDNKINLNFKNDAKEGFYHIEGVCKIDNNISYVYTYSAITSDNKLSLSTKCFKIKKGVGITGDSLGDYENTTLLFESNNIDSIPVLENFESISEKDSIKKSMGMVLINFMLIGVDNVFSSLKDKSINDL